MTMRLTCSWPRLSMRRPLGRVLAAGALLALALGTGGAQAEEPQPATSAAAADKPKITLKWTTASEVDNYGYFVFRGDDIDGPFQQMNAKAIPGAGNSDTPSNYVWSDDTVEPGKVYYYYLESISVQGVREKFSPVLSRRCCLAPTPAGANPPDAAATPPAPK